MVEITATEHRKKELKKKNEDLEKATATHSSFLA